MVWIDCPMCLRIVSILCPHSVQSFPHMDTSLKTSSKKLKKYFDFIKLENKMKKRIRSGKGEGVDFLGETMQAVGK